MIYGGSQPVLRMCGGIYAGFLCENVYYKVGECVFVAGLRNGGAF